MKDQNIGLSATPPSRLFGTDGIRGRANVYPMSPDCVLKLGQAIGWYFKKYYGRPRIAIGKDTRRSGYMLEQALSSGICSVGVDTLFLGPLPTPGIAYLTRGMRANAGIVISASHNRPSDNGIKIFSADGYKLPDEVEMKLEALALTDRFIGRLPTGRHIGTSQRVEDAVGQYAVFLKEQFPKHLSLERLRIVVDCAHGAAYRVAPKVFEELGAEVFLVGVSPDGSNINQQCGAMSPKVLAEKVCLYKADLGLAFDGDADRLLAVDHKGERLGGDEILAICGTHYLDTKRLKGGGLVATVMSNMGLDLALARHGGKVVRTQVGDRYVVEEMRRGGYNLGGEDSGHLIFRDCSTTGDGILAALALLEIVLQKETSLHELKRCMERLPSVTKNINVSCKVPLPELPELAKVLARIEEGLGKESRVLFRYSGTENKARIMVEGTEQARLEAAADEIAEIASRSLEQWALKQAEVMSA